MHGQLFHHQEIKMPESLHLSYLKVEINLQIKYIYTSESFFV